MNIHNQTANLHELQLITSASSLNMYLCFVILIPLSIGI